MERLKLVLGASVSLISVTLIYYFYKTKKEPTRRERGNAEITDTIFNAVGNTPLIKIESLSQATGCTILAKAEFLNPGGSSKDRLAKWTRIGYGSGDIDFDEREYIIEQAEKEGKLKPGYTIVEATAGSTGISLALLGRARGYNVQLFLPDNVSSEKLHFLKLLGAKLEKLRGFSGNVCRESKGAECSTSGSYLYIKATAPEIWKQLNGKIDGLVLASGTGGTLAGLSCYLKEKNPSLVTYLIDPPGSGLYHLVTHGVMFDRQDTLTVEPLVARSFYEGIGINRQTENFAKAKLDGAIKGTEKEGVEMAYHLLRNDGLFIGASSALNCVGAVKLAKKLGPGHVIVTVLSDGGHRYLSKLYNVDWLRAHDFTPQNDSNDLSFLDCNK